MLDAATAPRLASRMRAMRRAADHAHVPREVLAWPRSSPSTPTSPRRPASRSRSGRSPPARGSSPSPTDLPWFAQATIALVWADALRRGAGPARCRRRREPRYRRPRPLRHEPVAARLAAAAPRRPAGRRGRRPHGARGGRPRGARAVPQAGGGHPRQRLDRAGRARAGPERPGRLRRSTRARARTPRPCCASPAGACAWRRSARPRPLADILAAGAIVARPPGRPARATWPGAPAPRWPTLALGEREDALRLATEEVELARAFGGRARSESRCAPPASWPAARGRGPAARERGLPGARGDRARARAGAGRAGGAGARDGPALARRARCCARRSTWPTTRARRRWPTSPRPSYGPPAPSRAASP